MKINEKLILLFVACIALFLGQLLYQSSSDKQYSSLVQVYEQARDLKPFSLTSHLDKEFTNVDIQGKWSFVFLGYLSCPDICPMTLAKLSGLLPSLNKVSDNNAQVLFVSVDPARDSTDKIRQYVEYFSEDIIGLNAEHKNLYPFVRNLGLMYSIPEEGAEDYFVDHSASVVLLNPEGKIAAIFKPRIELKQVPTIDTELVLTDFEQIIK